VATPASIHGAMRPLGAGAASHDPVVAGLLSLAGARIPLNGDASIDPPQRDCAVVEDPASGAGRCSPNSAAARLHGLRRSRIGGISSKLPTRLPSPPPHLHEAPATSAIATSPYLVRVPPPHYVNPTRGGGKSLLSW
jgi:hypothetical protein